VTVALNHLIVPARDKWASANFLASILGVEAGPEWGRFAALGTGNGVTLDYADATDFEAHHYAFLVDDGVFDAALGRLHEADVPTYAGPNHELPGQINTLYGGRGVYFHDPSGHLMELITVPYGDQDEFLAWMASVH
jgi:catechol 2,3-dioxygenase-like lactoylglutathione lyase family enzyme